MGKYQPPFAFGAGSSPSDVFDDVFDDGLSLTGGSTRRSSTVSPGHGYSTLCVTFTMSLMRFGVSSSLLATYRHVGTTNCGEYSPYDRRW